MDKLKLENKKAGYSLLEVLISFAIFTILLGIVIFGFRNAKSIEAFKEETALFVSRLRGIQNNAITGQQVTYQGVQSVPVGGYGLHIDLNTPGNKYLIFADTTSVSGDVCTEAFGNQRYDNDSQYDPRCNDILNDPGNVELPDNIKIQRIVVNDSEGEKVLIVKAKSGDPYYDLIKNELMDFDLAFQNFKPFPYYGLRNEKIYRDPDNENYDSKKFRTIDFYFYHETLERCRKVTVSGSSGLVQEEATACP